MKEMEVVQRPHCLSHYSLTAKHQQERTSSTYIAVLGKTTTSYIQYMKEERQEQVAYPGGTMSSKLENYMILVLHLTSQIGKREPSLRSQERLVAFCGPDQMRILYCPCLGARDVGNHILRWMRLGDIVAIYLLPRSGIFILQGTGCSPPYTAFIGLQGIIRVIITTLGKSIGV